MNIDDDRLRRWFQQAGRTISVSSTLPPQEEMEILMNNSAKGTSRSSVAVIAAFVIASVAIVAAVMVGGRDSSTSTATTARESTNSPSGKTSPSPADPSTPTETDPPTNTDLQSVEAFAAWAVDDDAGKPSFGSQVELLVAGNRTETLSRTSALTRSNWQTCPTGSEMYADRKCPVSALKTLEILKTFDKAAPVFSMGVPNTVGCSRVSEPVDLASADAVVTIRPPIEIRNCASDFAVMTYLDGDGLIVAVDLVISGP